MIINDPRADSVPRFLEPTARLLNDERDVSFIYLGLKCALIAAIGIALYFLPLPILYAGPLYLVAMFFLGMDRFTLMLHCTSHRQLFKKEHRFLNHVIPWVLGPFFGQTPNTYFAHHMGMHHREENLWPDLSSTMRFQRDRFDHWLRYCLGFLFFGLPSLGSYLYKRKQWKLFGRVLFGEAVYWSCVVTLLILRPYQTLFVFVLPLILIRSLMMTGNWAQHAFVAADSPENPYRASITCINTRYNRRCFNDGYHILHHIKPRCHWTEHPIEFERALAEYGKNDAIVFDGLDYFQIAVLLLTGRWATLARHFVALEGAPVRTQAQVIAFLQSRVQRIARAEPIADSAEPQAA